MNQHAGNGHFIAISAPNLLTNALTGGNPLTHTDVTPLAQLFSEYIAFSVKADSPIGSAPDLLARLRRDPASLSIGIASARGATNHIAAGVVFKAAGIDLKRLKFVVFKSSAESMTALLGGHVDLDVATVSNVVQPLAAGGVRVLGVTAPQRLGGGLAQTPTWKEHGIDVDFSGWRGVIGPAGLNRQQIAYWDEVLAAIAGTEEWKKGLEKHLWVSTYMNSEASRKFLQSQYGELKLVLGDLGLSR
jgi:putative tricarboxylic transport membrane protein